MFTNKHVVVALLLAPILAILAWFAVGNLTGGQAVPAEAGATYPLLEKSNCRYASGVCDLENQDVSLSLTIDMTAGLALELTASHPLQVVLISISRPDQEATPRGMRALDTGRLKWRLPLSYLPDADERIRLAVRVDESTYFADAATSFAQELN